MALILNLQAGAQVVADFIASSDPDVLERQGMTDQSLQNRQPRWLSDQLRVHRHHHQPVLGVEDVEFRLPGMFTIAIKV